jgi:hypothetical protein
VEIVLEVIAIRVEGIQLRVQVWILRLNLAASLLEVYRNSRREAEELIQEVRP